MENTIKAQTTLTARSICDYDCVFSLKVISRTAKTAMIKFMGNEKRVKIQSDERGEYIKPDRYSMAPTFRAV